MRVRDSLLLLFVVIGATDNAQDLVLKDSLVDVAPGPQFAASGWKQFWWGKHYRPEWCLTNRFPVIDLDATAGGLTALERGGGHETKSLRLMGANGREYVLRTIDKSLDVLIPEPFKETIISGTINDQISTAHPYGPPAVARLAAAAELPHTTPTILFVPANNRLGQFSPDFAGKLCLFEQRVSGKGWNGTALTGYADDVVNSTQLYEKLVEHPNHFVDQRAFLKVRLFDVFINDWDRHEDQWVWLAKKKGNNTVYTPLGRDRDQSFSKTDGIFLWLLATTGTIPSLQNLDAKVKNVKNTALSGVHLDRQFLNELTENDWREAILALQAALPDTLIAQAVASMPASINNLSGEQVTKRLISRRNDMLRYGLEYYKILSREVDVLGTEKNELFEATTVDDSVLVTVSHLSDAGTPTYVLYHRAFPAGETKKLHLFGRGGRDVFKIDPSVGKQLHLDIIGNGAADTYVEAGTSGKRVDVFVPKAETEAVPKIYKVIATDNPLLNTYERNWYRYNRSTVLFTPSYTPDDGLFLGAEYALTKQKRGKTPFDWRQSIGASVAFKTGATVLSYRGIFTSAVGKWDLDVPLVYRGPQYVFNFYGFGNNTKRTSDDDAFNRVRVKQLFLNPSLVRRFSHSELRMGVIGERIELEPNRGKFITTSEAGIGQNLFHGNIFLGGNVGYAFSSANRGVLPTKGFLLQSSVSGRFNATEGHENFVAVGGAVGFYLPLAKSLVLAHRSGAATNFGDFEFYHANTLGGESNLRGYKRTRFAGRTSFYQNTELRLKLGSLKGYVLNGPIGIYAFGDDGRVWYNKESDSDFHCGYGGGVFFCPFSLTTLNISYGHSNELNTVQFKVGFLF